MYRLFKGESHYIHNLTNIELPEYIKFILSFGLRFCLLTKINDTSIKQHLNEAIRKISWITYFKSKDEDKQLSDLDKFLIRIKKSTNVCKSRADIETEIFPNKNLVNDFLSMIKSKYKSLQFLPNEVINNFKTFINTNQIIIKSADKNAGLCIMYKSDYDEEIYRELSNEYIYIPSTKVQYEMSMSNFTDRIKAFKTKINSNISVSTLINENHKPSNFYILPKIHKEFSKFPPGRPISSTCSSINKQVSQFVDFILKPSLPYIPNLIIDTNHLLLLLDNVQLCKNEKHALITYDINSMYTNLKRQNCKTFCLKAFNDYIQSNLMSTIEFKNLLDLCLDFNHIVYENNYYNQTQGIQMGNSASVTIANITTDYELRDLFKNMNEIVFNVRFVDDGFLIIKSTSIANINEWCKNVFQHSYLTFTYEYNEMQLIYLDVNVNITINNTIYTSFLQSQWLRVFF